MIRFKIIEDYSGLSDSQLDIQAKAGIKCLKTNAKFSFVNNELTDVEAESTVFSSALVATANGDKNSVPIKNKTRGKLLIKLSKLCKETNVQGDGIGRAHV